VWLQLLPSRNRDAHIVALRLDPAPSIHYVWGVVYWTLDQVLNDDVL
jgi:hypothetical protein